MSSSALIQSSVEITEPILDALALHTEGLTFDELLQVLAWDKVSASDDVHDPKKYLKAQRGKLNRLLAEMLRNGLIAEHPWGHERRSISALNFAWPGSPEHQNSWAVCNILAQQSAVLRGTESPPRPSRINNEQGTDPNEPPRDGDALVVYKATPALLGRYRERLSPLQKQLEPLFIPVSSEERIYLDERHEWFSNALDQYWLQLSDATVPTASQWYRTSAIRSASGDESEVWCPDVVILHNEGRPPLPVFNALPIMNHRLFKAMRDHYDARGIQYAMHLIKMPQPE